MRKQRIRITLKNRTLKEIDMSDFSVIPADMFAYRNDIYAIELPEGVTIIKRSAFEGCTSLRKVVLPKSVERIEEEAFYNCYSLAEINIPGCTKVHQTAFYNCEHLKKIS